MGDPYLEAFFGNPAALAGLARALERVSEGLWQLRARLDGQVSSLVPARWEGAAASAFQQHWRQRSDAVKQTAEMARQMRSTMQTLSDQLDHALRLFQTAEREATLAGLRILPTGQVVPVTPNPSTAAMAAVSGQVSAARGIATAARFQARTDLGVIGGLAGLGLLQDLVRSGVLGIGSTVQALEDVASASWRFSWERTWTNPQGVWNDTKRAGEGVVQGVEGIGQKLYTFLKFVGRTDPIVAELDPQQYLKNVQENGKVVDDWIKKTLDRPGDVVTGIGTFATETVIAGRLGALAKQGWATAAARLERETAAAEAAAATRRQTLIGRAGVGNEAASAELMAQRGERAVDLNKMPHTGPGDYPTWDKMSDRTFYSDKAHGLYDGGKLSQGTLGKYERDFRNLVDPETSGPGNAASKLLDSRNADQVAQLQKDGIWPKDLPAGASADQVVDFSTKNGVMNIPDDHVAQVRTWLRGQIRDFPENFGLPEGVTPTEAQISQFTDRVAPSGITSSALARIAPPVPTAPVP
jgi:uncharacterized protein YukE